MSNGITGMHVQSSTHPGRMQPELQRCQPAGWAVYWWHALQQGCCCWSIGPEEHQAHPAACAPAAALCMHCLPCTDQGASTMWCRRFRFSTLTDGAACMGDRPGDWLSKLPSIWATGRLSMAQAHEMCDAAWHAGVCRLHHMSIQYDKSLQTSRWS